MGNISRLDEHEHPQSRKRFNLFHFSKYSNLAVPLIGKHLVAEILLFITQLSLFIWKQWLTAAKLRTEICGAT